MKFWNCYFTFYRKSCLFVTTFPVLVFSHLCYLWKEVGSIQDSNLLLTQRQLKYFVGGISSWFKIEMTSKEILSHFQKNIIIVMLCFLLKFQLPYRKPFCYCLPIQNKLKYFPTEISHNYFYCKGQYFLFDSHRRNYFNTQLKVLNWINHKSKKENPFRLFIVKNLFFIVFLVTLMIIPLSTERRILLD